MSGGSAGLDGDVVAEGLQLSDGVVLGAFGVASRVVVRAGFVVVGAGCQHPPDEGEQGVFDSDDGFGLASALGQSLVLDVEERAGVAGDRQRGCAEGAFDLSQRSPGRVLLDFFRPADS